MNLFFLQSIIHSLTHLLLLQFLPQMSSFYFKKNVILINYKLYRLSIFLSVYLFVSYKYFILFVTKFATTDSLFLSKFLLGTDLICALITLASIRARYMDYRIYKSGYPVSGQTPSLILRSILILVIIWCLQLNFICKYIYIYIFMYLFIIIHRYSTAVNIISKICRLHVL